jgi:hypothetical protein
MHCDSLHPHITVFFSPLPRVVFRKQLKLTVLEANNLRVLEKSSIEGLVLFCIRKSVWLYKSASVRRLRHRQNPSLWEIVRFDESRSRGCRLCYPVQRLHIRGEWTKMRWSTCIWFANGCARCVLCFVGVLTVVLLRHIAWELHQYCGRIKNLSVTALLAVVTIVGMSTP